MQETQETWGPSLGREDPLEKEVANPLQYSGLENPHGQRSLAGYSPWGRKELDMTERLSATCDIVGQMISGSLCIIYIFWLIVGMTVYIPWTSQDFPD